MGTIRTQEQGELVKLSGIGGSHWRRINGGFLPAIGDERGEKRRFCVKKTRERREFLWRLQKNPQSEGNK